MDYDNFKRCTVFLSCSYDKNTYGRVGLMRRLRQFLIFSWPFTISYFIASIIMSVLIAVFIPGIDKYPDLNSYIHSPFGLSFLMTLLSHAFVLIILSFSLSEFFQKRRRIHSSSRFRVMVDIEGKKVYLDVPNRE